MRQYVDGGTPQNQNEYRVSTHRVQLGSSNKCQQLADFPSLIVQSDGQHYVEGFHSCSVCHYRRWVFCSIRRLCIVDALVMKQQPVSYLSSSSAYCVSPPACFEGSHSVLTNCTQNGLCNLNLHSLICNVLKALSFGAANIRDSSLVLVSWLILDLLLPWTMSQLAVSFSQCLMIASALSFFTTVLRLMIVSPLILDLLLPWTISQPACGVLFHCTSPHDRFRVDANMSATNVMGIGTQMECWSSFLNYVLLDDMLELWCTDTLGTLLVPHYPEMPPSMKNGDNTGRTTLSGTAAMRKDRNSTGTTSSGNAAVSKKRGQYWYHRIRKCRCQWETGTILVPHYPEMPPSVKNGDITGTTVSRNAAVSEKRGQYCYHIMRKWRPVRNVDITRTTLWSGNAAMRKFIAVT